MKVGRIVTVTGYGEIKAKPDIAYMRVRVENDGKTTAEASSANAVAAQKLIDALLEAGIPKDNIETSNVTTNPSFKEQEDENGDTKSVIDGYKASNRIKVTIENMDRVGEIFDVVTSSGNNLVEGTQFGLLKDKKLNEKTLKMAVQDARSKAELIAEAEGETVKYVQNIRLEGGYHENIAHARSAMSMDSASTPTPVVPPELTVSSTVSADYSLKNKKS